MLHTIKRRLEIYIDIHIEINGVEHYTKISTARIFRLNI